MQLLFYRKDRMGGLEGVIPGDSPPGVIQLTRVLFDYYFSTYRALVTSLWAHMWYYPLAGQSCHMHPPMNVINL